MTHLHCLAILMKSDAIVIGAELDGLIAAMRLAENGHSVQVLSNGMSSLNYAPDGIQVLGHIANGIVISDPFDAISSLDSSHPYRILGADQLKQALEWYVDVRKRLGLPVVVDSNNQQAISAAGLPLPVYATTEHQATFDKVHGKITAIIRFAGHRDSPGELLANGLARQSIQSVIVEFDSPGSVVENAALAKTFDTMDALEHYFECLRKEIPEQIQAVVFPAVMGLKNHQSVLSTAERVLGLPCFEIPTLPLSVPGMRLEQGFRKNLKEAGVVLQTGVYPTACSIGVDDRINVTDESGRNHQASVVVLSSGGVLMGGLDVDSRGRVQETAFELDVYQTAPLTANGPNEVLDALHNTGVDTDYALRPKMNSTGYFKNLFVTGHTLAHWNPSKEGSANGVCIATGWVAAGNALMYLEERNAA